MLRKILLFAVLAAFLPISLRAQSTTGKIVGKVFDAQTREPLIGASVKIENTRLGGTTNINGQFTILNVPVGTYSLKASYVGYKEFTNKGIKVSIGLTSESNFQLSSESVTTGEIVVQVERPLVEKTATTKTQVVTGEQINNLPIRGIASIVGLSAGVVQDEKNTNNTYVRGGRAGEVAYYVDGVLQNNPFNNTPGATVGSASVQEVQFQTTFDAEYGNANSGVVNITTKDPVVDKYSIFSEIETDGLIPLNNQFLGVRAYGYNLYNLQVSGPLLPIESEFARRLSFFAFGERQFLSDASPTVGFNALSNNKLSSWSGNAKLRYDAGSGIDIKLGGNIQRSSRTFFSLARYNTEAPIVRLVRGADGFLPRDANGNEIYQPETYFDPSVNQNVTALDFVPLNNSNHNQRNEEFNAQAYLRYTQTLNSKTYLVAALNFYRYTRDRGDDVLFDNIGAYGQYTNFTQRYDPTRANVSQEDPQALYGSTSANTNYQPFFNSPGRPFNLYDKLNITYFELRGDFETQVDIHNIRAGGQYRYNTLRFYSLSPSESVNFTTDAGGFRNYFLDLQASGYDNIGYSPDGTSLINDGNDGAKNPIVASIYAKDKIELKDFTLNFGLRLDYLNSNTRALKDLVDPYQFGDRTILDNDDFENSKQFAILSPRISFSFPVTDRTVFHAQYGRFTQLPQLANLYTSTFQLDQQIRQVGGFQGSNNPNLAPEKTSMYEIGFTQQLGLVAAFDITAFYKETRDLIQYLLFTPTSISAGVVPPHSIISNADFGTTRGFDITFRLRNISYFTADVNYTLQYATGTGSGDLNKTLQALRTDEFAYRSISPLDFDQRHTLTINADLRLPQNDQTIPAPLRGLGLNALFTMGSGRAYTLSTSTIDLGTTADASVSSGLSQTIASARNINTGPWTYRLDLRLDKSFMVVDRVNIAVVLKLINALGTQNAVGIYPTTGLPDNAGYLGTTAADDRLQGIQNTYGQVGVDKYLDLRSQYERRPTFLGTAQQIRFGIQVTY